jgi:hypothetical protein
MMQIEWELPLSVLEEMLNFEFDFEDEARIIKCEHDKVADAIYITFTVDSGDFERIPESNSIGHHIV